MSRPRSSASRVSVFDACALSRRNSSIRARMVAKSSAARGRVTSPPQNLTEPFSGSHGVSGWVCPVKGSPTSRTQGCRRKQKSSDRSEEAEGAFDQSGGCRRPISIAVEIVDRNCRIHNLMVELITIPAGEPRQNSLDGWFILAQSAEHSFDGGCCTEAPDSRGAVLLQPKIASASLQREIAG